MIECGGVCAINRSAYTSHINICIYLVRCHSIALTVIHVTLNVASVFFFEIFFSQLLKIFERGDEMS